MASIASIEICPRCHADDYYTTDYYRTGEFSNMCLTCGKFESSFWLRDDAGKLVTKDGTENYEFDNLTENYQSLPEPFGVYQLLAATGSGSIGVLETSADYETFLAHRADIEADEKIKTAFISFYRDGEIKREIIKGEPDAPPPLTEGEPENVFQGVVSSETPF